VSSSWFEMFGAASALSARAFSAVHAAPDVGRRAMSLAEIRMPLPGATGPEAGDGVALGAGVVVGAGVAVGAVVGVADGVALGDAVGVALGVAVGVALGVAVGTGLGVAVA